jgi:hypothetical protein
MADAIAHQSGLYEPFYCQEDRYESHLSALAPYVFPDYLWCNFKAEIWSDYGKVHADAALISRNYDHWFVVEVELARHSWIDHIKPQLSRLLYGRYERRHRQHLINKNQHLDPARIENLDIYNPEIALIIETAPDYVRSWCRQNGILCLQASPYRSVQNQYALTLVGDRPHMRQAAMPRIVDAVVRLSTTDEFVPQLSYLFDCPLANLQQQFEIQVGDTRILAQNFGDNPVKIVLTYERSLFLNIVGEASLYDIVSVEPNVYQIMPRRNP